MHRIRIHVVVVAATVLVTTTLNAQAFLDLYGGASYTHSTDVDAEDYTFFPPLYAEADLDFDTSLSLGVRIGSYLPMVPWLGFALDMSYFSAEGDELERNDIVPFSTLIMVRFPILRSRRHKFGQIQPYLAVGPSIFYWDAKLDLRPEIPQKISDNYANIGLDARAGIAWEFARHLAVFTEYRFTYFEQELEDGIDTCCYRVVLSTADITMITHHLLVGISLRF